MRITEHLLEPDVTGPWGQIAKRCAQAYRQTTGKSFDGALLEQASMYSGVAGHGADPVAWGFARKAVGRMQSTCQLCGSVGKCRLDHGRAEVRCAACQLAKAYSWELKLLHSTKLDAAGQPRQLWPEADFPELLRASIPSDVWRKLPLAEDFVLRYLTVEDLQKLMPWLTQLATILVAESRDRMKRMVIQGAPASEEGSDESC